MPAARTRWTRSTTSRRAEHWWAKNQHHRVTKGSDVRLATVVILAKHLVVGRNRAASQ